MKILNSISSVFLLFILISKTNAQVGIGITPPDPSAMLHVQATDKGMLIPRMTDAQRIAIVSPAQGLLVYQTNADEGFWFFKSGQWVNLTASNNGGKHTLYLADGITNAEAVAKIATDVGPNTQEVRIVRCSNLTNVDLSMITSLTEIYISENTVLQSVNFDNVQSVDGGVYVDQCPALTTMPTTHLTSIGQTVLGTYGLQLTSSGLVNLSLPLVTRINGTIKVTDNTALTAISCPVLTSNSSITIKTNANLASISFPLLNKAGSLSVSTNHLTTVNFPVLANTTGGVGIDHENYLTSISFPVLAQTGSAFMHYNPLLTTFSFPLLAKTGTFYLTNNNGLISFSFPVLTKMSSVIINTNPVLNNMFFSCAG
ncbi:MAG: hypothetical protein QM737_21700 [Ferruginibacter sp.]